ncbi:hypothetical protein E2C01_058104 [Portunus trituberculatus]|uniref:Uncharacterized protein n=1 Tax=Portunus trituberculatus TaxID=210409 RepID=A0A5B7H2V6_PORTR|nr:hypothetical protein [Portunus trituberculatus]
MEAMVMTWMYTVKALAGSDHHRLLELIPLLLQHNSLLSIEIATKSFSTPRLMRTSLTQLNPA